MPIDIIMSPPNPNNPFEIARRKMIAAIAALKAPIIGSWPEPGDFEDVRDHILDIMEIADEWLKAIGQEVASNSYCKLDMTQFEGRLEDAVNGWATHEVMRAAHAAEEENEEAA